MTCAEFDRWLDDGMREADATTARGHAASCARCAAALQAALAIEAVFSNEAAALRSVPARAPEGFASSVMARLGEGAARSRQVAEAPAPRWWMRLLSDPVSAVSITVALLALLLLIWNPAWFFRVGGLLGARWLHWVARAGEIPVSSTIWLAITATAIPFAIWWLWQIARKLERAMVLQMTRPGA